MLNASDEAPLNKHELTNEVLSSQCSTKVLYLYFRFFFDRKHHFVREGKTTKEEERSKRLITSFMLKYGYVLNLQYKYIKSTVHYDMPYFRFLIIINIIFYCNIFLIVILQNL